MIKQNNNSMCRQAKLYYYDCLSGESAELIPESISSHIDKCKNCRREVRKLETVLLKKECIKSGNRQNASAVTTMLELHFAYIGKPVTCKTVRPFLPGLLDPSIEIRIPTPITVHLDNCPRCVEDLKEIRNLGPSGTQLYQMSRLFTEGPSPETAELSETAPSLTAMAQRANSDVITIYHVDQSAKEKQVGESDDLYSGFPINVEVINQKVDDEQPVPAINFTAALKEKVKMINLKPWLKIGVAAAAVIIVGFALLLNTTPAEADIGDKIYSAIENVENVYISTFNSETNKLEQEQWISRTSNIYMSKTAKAFVLCDIQTGQMKTKDLNTSIVNVAQMTENVKVNIEQKISGHLGLMPFYETSGLPQGHKWLQPDDQIPRKAEGIEIYDLIWSDKTNPSFSNKWRFFIDSETFLPEKIEIYEISSDDTKDKLRMRFEIRSVKDNEIQKVIDGF